LVSVHSSVSATGPTEANQRCSEFEAHCNYSANLIAQASHESLLTYF
jgi:hypothetical protein